MTHTPINPHTRAVSVDDARAHLARLLPERRTHHVPLTAALQQVLAEPLRARADHPSLTESAMDGFACRTDDTLSATPDAPVSLRVVGEVRAGRSFASHVGAGEAVRVFTGAPMPFGADGVVRREDTREADGAVWLRVPARSGDVRPQGADFFEGDVVLPAGTRLTPHRVALAAAAGHARLPVRAPLRVALLASGDELLEPGRPLVPGQVFDANTYGLFAALTALGHQPTLLPRVTDDPSALQITLEDRGGVDLLITSGGVSEGRYDVVRQLLQTQGEVAFQGVRMRPGAPVTAGRWRDLPVIGLPGNPVAALVAFEVLVRPALQGEALRPLRLRAASPFRAAPGRTAFWRAVLRGAEVIDHKEQGSGMLRALTEADALVVVPDGRAVQVGELVDVLVL